MTGHWRPQGITGQMMATLIALLVLLLGILTALEYFEYDTVMDTAEGPLTVERLRRILPVFKNLDQTAAQTYVDNVGHCHDGYTLSPQPHQSITVTAKTQSLAYKLANQLSLSPDKVSLGFALLHRTDFAYKQCSAEEMAFPVDGIVISIELTSGQWLNAEVHPHEWHLTPSLLDWIVRSTTAFVLVGIVAFFFVRRLSNPLKALANSASAFASGLQLRALEESGPREVRQTIQAFNVMQRQVVDEMKRRNATLAAISHDLRSPLTALRLKAELVEDSKLRADQIASIDKMERTTATALTFLKGEARSEKRRLVDLGELVASECDDFRESGCAITFDYPVRITYRCRTEALARAVRNLIENAAKYAGSADVSITATDQAIEITVSDHGPGIPADQFDRALLPFERLSVANDSPSGGFGLGLAIAKASVAGHDGSLHLAANQPSGLMATIRLPLSSRD